jgi:hypothetical protein
LRLSRGVFAPLFLFYPPTSQVSGVEFEVEVEVEVEVETEVEVEVETEVEVELINYGVIG